MTKRFPLLPESLIRSTTNFLRPLDNMSHRTYIEGKPVIWLHGEIKTSPFSRAARIEAGFLLRRLQLGELIEMPLSRPMPVIGSNCHELRIQDSDVTWRVIYHIDTDAIVILDVFSKKTRATPQQLIDIARKRLRRYQLAMKEDES